MQQQVFSMRLQVDRMCHSVESATQWFERMQQQVFSMRLQVDRMCRSVESATQWFE
jgi:hypothetical protein